MGGVNLEVQMQVGHSNPSLWTDRTGSFWFYCYLSRYFFTNLKEIP